MQIITVMTTIGMNHIVMIVMTVIALKTTVINQAQYLKAVAAGFLELSLRLTMAVKMMILHLKYLILQMTTTSKIFT